MIPKDIGERARAGAEKDGEVVKIFQKKTDLMQCEILKNLDKREHEL